jgi:hypothetical protein
VSEWTEYDSAAVSATLVAHDGHRMPLRGRERELAIQMMTRVGLSADVMAIRLCTTVKVIQTAARRARAQIPRQNLNRWAAVARIPELRERDRQRSRRVAA